jgi:hypothetical protein
VLPGRKRQRVAGSELRVKTIPPQAQILATRHQLLVTAPKAPLDSLPATRHSLPQRRTTQRGTRIYKKESFTQAGMFRLNFAGGNAWD